MSIPHPFMGFEIVEAVDGRFIVLNNGIQWGCGPHDKSGCSSETWETPELALAAIQEQIAF